MTAHSAFLLVCCLSFFWGGGGEEGRLLQFGRRIETVITIIRQKRQLTHQKLLGKQYSFDEITKGDLILSLTPENRS